jgi:hypothetical protein
MRNLLVSRARPRNGKFLWSYEMVVIGSEVRWWMYFPSSRLLTVFNISRFVYNFLAVIMGNSTKYYQTFIIVFTNYLYLLLLLLLLLQSRSLCAKCRYYWNFGVIQYCILWCKASNNTIHHSWNKMFLFFSGRVRPAPRSVLHAIYLDRTGSA